MKKNIIIFIISFFIIFDFFICIKYNKKYDNYVNEYKETIEYLENNPEIYEDLISNGYQIDQPQIADTVSLFETISWESLTIFNFVLPLLIMVISGYKINKDIKSGMLKNILTRKKYKNYVMNIVLNAWFKSLIAPLFWLMILVTCFIMSGTFILRDGFGSSGIITGNTILLIILYFIYLVIHSLFCANLSLIFNEKNNNFMLNILFSYLTFFCINYYLCSILWYGVETYLSYYSSFPNYDIVAVFSLATQDFLYAGGGYLLFFIKIIVCFLISLLGVISTYYNKEKVVIECEK